MNMEQTVTNKSIEFQINYSVLCFPFSGHMMRDTLLKWRGFGDESYFVSVIMTADIDFDICTRQNYGFQNDK